MTVQSYRIGRSPAIRARLKLRKQALAIPLRGRIDIVVGAMAIVTVTVAVILLYVGVLYVHRQGLLDPPVIRPVADERLLSNVRTDLRAESLLDAVFHGPERRLYLSEQGGIIHAYDPRTDLWSSERPFSEPNSGITGDLVLLRSGCGQAQSLAPARPCPDPNSLWGVSSRGGLVRRVNGQWQVVIADARWLGRTGKPVQNDQLTAAATSPDGRWVLLGTRQDGVGLYDNSSHSWVDAAIFATLPQNPPATTTIVWWNNAFWIGGPDGLTILRPAEQYFTANPTHTGAILSLAAEYNGPLWILERRTCADGSTGCLRFTRLQAQGTEDTLLDERTIYHELDLNTLIFAQQQGQHLVVAGDNGIFVYDLLSHTWTKPFNEHVLTVLARPQGDGFYFAYPGGVGQMQGMQVERRWKIGSDQVRQLLFGRDSQEILAFTDAGNLLTLGPGATAQVVYESGSTALDPSQFTVAADLDDLVFFLGPQGVLLHNPTSRTYTDIPASELPSWMLQPDLQAYRSADSLYFVAEAGATMSIYPVPVDQLKRPAAYTGPLRSIRPITLSGPARQFWSWPGRGLGVLDGQGSVFSVTASGATEQTGPPEMDLDGQTIRDVTAQGDNLIVATDAGVLTYDTVSRTWSRGSSIPQHVVELGAYQGQTLGRSDQQELLALSDPSGVLIGPRNGSQISDQDLSDARMDAQQLYLAGQGRVEHYDPSARAITDRWQLSGTGPVALRGVIDGQPLALNNSQAFLGNQLIDDAAGPVVSLSASSSMIWTERRDGTNLYLKGYDSTGPFDGSASQCFFRSPATPEPFTRIDDARTLPPNNNVTVVSTDAGLMFYVAPYRSWYAAANDVGVGGGRLYLLGNYLALATPAVAPTSVSIIPLSSISIPDSCATDPVRLSVDTYPVRGAAFDETSHPAQAAWIGPDGAVTHWQNGQVQPTLAVEGGPNITQFRRVFRRATYLLFTTSTGLWRYDLPAHRWTQINLDLNVAPSASLEIDAEASAGGDTITVRSGSMWYSGELTAGANEVAMTPLLVAPQSTFGAAASDLTDVVGSAGGIWTFVLKNQLKYYDPNQRSWVGAAAFPDADAGRTLSAAFDRQVAVSSHDHTWWVATTTGDQPATFARFDLQKDDQVALTPDGGIWRLTSAGVLQQCAQTDLLYACQTRHAPPLLLRPSMVRSAYVWEGLVLFDTPVGLRTFDPRTGAEIPLRHVPLLGAIKVARRDSSQLFLYDGSTLVALTKGRGVVQALSWASVGAFVFDAVGRPWIRMGNAWMSWTGSGWAAPLRQGQAAGVTVRLFVMEGTSVSGIDSAGRLYQVTAQGSLRVASRLPLPAALARSAVDLLISGPEGQWWARSGHVLRHVALQRCPALVAPPPPPNPRAAATSLSPSPATSTPCLVIDGTVTLPSDFVQPETPALARAGVRSLVLERSDGKQVAIVVTPQGMTVSQTQQVPPTPAGVLFSQWGVLGQYDVRLPNGQAAYDPIDRLVTDRRGRLIAARPTTTTVEAAAATLQLQPASALDAGWLRWDRSTEQFVVQGSSGTLTLPKDQFIHDGQLLFEPVGAVLAAAPDLFYVANQYGVWTYNQTTAQLGGGTVSFQPLRLQAPFRAVRARFLTAGGDVPVGGVALQPAQQRYTVPLDGAEITEQIRQQHVTATFLRWGQHVTAQTPAGFVWDRQRRGIGYDAGRLYLQTDAGIAPADQFGPFDPGPGGASPSGTLFSDPSVGLLVDDGGALYKWANGTWTISNSDPRRTRPLLTLPLWDWTLHDGQVTITLHGQAFGFTFGPNGTGNGFSFDSLQAATVFQDKLFVMSRAFLEIADDPSGLASLTARRLPPRPTTDLLSLDAATGPPTLFHYDLRGVSRWDANTGTFIPVPSQNDPKRTWPLVAQSRLRMIRQGTYVLKEVRLDDLVGRSHWVPFNLVGGRFPFDVVTSFESYYDRLYVGTAAGLEVYSTPQVGLDQIVQLYDLSGKRSGLVAVARVGRPRANPGLLMARGAICIEFSGSASPHICHNPSLLDNRLRVSSDLWEWTEVAGGQLVGVYRSRTGATLPVVIAQGRLPHDRVRAVTVCQNRAFTLWENGWVTAYSDDSLALRAVLVNDAVGAMAGRMLCLTSDVPFAHDLLLHQGAYLADAAGHVWNFMGDEWQRVTDTTTAGALKEYAMRPPIVQYATLRLRPRTPMQPFAFEQRTLTGRWLPVPWDGDHVALDHWSSVVAIGDVLWAATPVGLVQFIHQPGSQATLDPDALVIVREPAPSGHLCPITDLLAQAGSRVVARCNADSQQVYRGVLNGTRDQGIFIPSREGDPFAEQPLVPNNPTTPSFWHWSIEGRHNYNRGQIVVSRTASGQQDVITLSDGHFDFDAITSLALFHVDTLEVASRGGWFEIPASARACQTVCTFFDASSWTRPSYGNLDPSAVSAVATGLTETAPNGTADLCVLTRGGTETLRPDGSIDSGPCLEHLGKDNLWSYDRELSTDPSSRTLVITHGIGTRRQLTDGHFTDDSVRGTPITGRQPDGTPYYLVPTEAGILKLDSSLNSQTITPTLSIGPSTAAPSVLYMVRPDDPAVLFNDRLYSLGGDQEAVSADLALPHGATAVAVDSNGPSQVRITWTVVDTRGWQSVALDGAGQPQPDDLTLDLRSLQRFKENSLAWAGVPATATVHIASDAVTLYWPNATHPHTYRYPSALDLIGAVSYGDRVLIVGTRDIYEFNLEPALLAAFRAD